MGRQWARYGSLPSIDQNDLEISIDTHLPTERVEIGSLKTSLGRAAKRVPLVGVCPADQFDATLCTQSSSKF